MVLSTTTAMLDKKFGVKKAIEIIAKAGFDAVDLSLCGMREEDNIFNGDDYREKAKELLEIARQNGFDNAERPDSQDICFVNDGDYASFIEHYLGRQFPEGDFVDLSGKVLGRHRGIIRYTVGQRKGLGLSLPAPLYVKEKDIEKNRVVLAPEEALYAESLVADRINLISVPDIQTPMRVRAKVRYRQTEQWATVVQTDCDRIRVSFDTPQRAISPGQSVVLYDGDTVVGGGRILYAE